jgi:hypothetical protein
MMTTAHAPFPSVANTTLSSTETENDIRLIQVTDYNDFDKQQITESLHAPSETLPMRRTIPQGRDPAERCS